LKNKSGIKKEATCLIFGVDGGETVMRVSYYILLEKGATIINRRVLVGKAGFQRRPG
jgi:hypothetical protein